jgi:hypothetical protein
MRQRSVHGVLNLGKSYAAGAIRVTGPAALLGGTRLAALAWCMTSRAAVTVIR